VSLFKNTSSAEDEYSGGLVSLTNSSLTLAAGALFVGNDASFAGHPKPVWRSGCDQLVISDLH
jgi:hypothetical protein